MKGLIQYISLALFLESHHSRASLDHAEELVFLMGTLLLVLNSETRRTDSKILTTVMSHEAIVNLFVTIKRDVAR